MKHNDQGNPTRNTRAHFVKNVILVRFNTSIEVHAPDINISSYAVFVWFVNSVTVGQMSRPNFRMLSFLISHLVLQCKGHTYTPYLMFPYQGFPYGILK